MSSSVVVVLFLSNTSDADGSLGAKGEIREFFLQRFIPKNPGIGPKGITSKKPGVSNWNFSITSDTWKKWPKRRPRRPFSSTIGVDPDRIPTLLIWGCFPINGGLFTQQNPWEVFSGSKNDQHLGWVLVGNSPFFWKQPHGTITRTHAKQKKDWKVSDPPNNRKCFRI